MMALLMFLVLVVEILTVEICFVEIDVSFELIRLLCSMLHTVLSACCILFCRYRCCRCRVLVKQFYTLGQDSRALTICSMGRTVHPSRHINVGDPKLRWMAEVNRKLSNAGLTVN